MRQNLVADLARQKLLASDIEHAVTAWPPSGRPWSCSAREHAIRRAVLTGVCRLGVWASHAPSCRRAGGAPALSHPRALGRLGCPSWTILAPAPRFQIC